MYIAGTADIWHQETPSLCMYIHEFWEVSRYFIDNSLVTDGGISLYQLQHSWKHYYQAFAEMFWQ